jgi:hypothetical protein
MVGRLLYFVPTRSWPYLAMIISRIGRFVGQGRQVVGHDTMDLTVAPQQQRLSVLSRRLGCAAGSADERILGANQFQ